MKIEFKNGSNIESISSIEKSIRSKRGENYLRYLKMNPYNYINMTMLWDKLKWYQKLLIKFECKLCEIKIKLMDICFNFKK